MELLSYNWLKNVIFYLRGKDIKIYSGLILNFSKEDHLQVTENVTYFFVKYHWSENRNAAIQIAMSLVPLSAQKLLYFYGKNTRVG